MKQGQRVNTPGGPGHVAYVRMGPPNYTSPVAVSVVLDLRRASPDYTGTVYGAEQVTAIIPCPKCGSDTRPCGTGEPDVHCDRCDTVTPL